MCRECFRMTTTDCVVYEFPCNEKVRTCMRLEKSLQRMHYFIEQDNETAHMSAFGILFELIELTARPDLRKDLIQELQRNRSILNGPHPPAHLDAEQLSDYLARIDKAVHDLTTPNPAVRSPQSLRDNDWLSTVRARSKIPGGNCCFDLPSLHYWLGKPFEERYAHFTRLLSSMGPIEQAVDVILDLLRGTISRRSCTAQAGNVNLSIPSGVTWSLIRITLPTSSIHIPEVSVNKFMLWIHFLDAADSMKTPPSRATIDFDLGLCGL